MSRLAHATEIGPGRYAIAGRTGARRLFTYVVVSGGEALLIDAGEAGTPDASILPAFDEIGLAPEALRWVVITHPDVDHQGGLARLLEVARDAVPLCGFEDRALIRDGELMLQERYLAYTDHGLAYSEVELAEIRANYGGPVKVEATLVGGERLRVGDIELRTHHAPGHSAGHLMIEDPAEGTLFISDAVHGRCSPGIDGQAALPVTYEDVDAYLRTIAAVRALGPATVYSAHFPPLRGSQVTEFLDESEAFVAELDGFVLAEINAAPRTLADLCAGAGNRFGPYLEPAALLRFAVHGHLRRLARQGRAQVVVRPGQLPRFAAIAVGDQRPAAG